jgi:hypothetical protein
MALKRACSPRCRQTGARSISAAWRSSALLDGAGLAARAVFFVARAKGNNQCAISGPPGGIEKFAALLPETARAVTLS